MAPKLFRLPRSLRRIDREVDDELRFHIESRIAELMSEGSSPDEARAMAEREYGDLAASRAELAAVDRRIVTWRRRVELFDVVRQDLLYAVRGLRMRPGFAAAVILTLALGIGANAAVFSVVDRLLFRSPPMLSAPATTNRVYLAFPSPEENGAFFFVEDVPYARYLDLANGTRSFQRTAGYSVDRMAVRLGKDVVEMRVAAVTSSFFAFFDAPPVRGRYFSAGEDAPPTGARVAVLSYEMWRTQYGGNDDVVGATLHIGSAAYTVVGVAPRRFAGLWPVEPPVAFIPASAHAAATAERDPGQRWWTSYRHSWGTMLVQRKPGVSLAAANADLTAASRRSWLNEGGPATLRPYGLAESVLTERGPNHGSVSRVAALVGGMAIIVLLIATANVANLLMARALRRRREIAVRLALGVSRRRLVSQLLTESVLLAVLGGTAGLIAAQFGGAALRSAFLPPGTDSPVMGDARTVALVAIMVLVVGVLTGIAPVWIARHVDITRDLKAGLGGGRFRTSKARASLLVMQGALSVILLVGAGLFVQSLNNVKHLRLGYDVDPVLSVALNMRDVTLDSARAVALRERLLSAVRRVPGVERAALSLAVPLEWSYGQIIRLPGFDETLWRRIPGFEMNAVSPEYFATLGTHIIRGRGIEAADTRGAPGAVVVSRSMARLLWPGTEALGQCVKEGEDPACRYVVGIAEDVRTDLLSDDHGYAYYLSAAQYPPHEMALVVRTRGHAALQMESIRRALQAEMPAVSFVSLKPLANVLGARMQSWQLGATMFLAFGLLALILAAIGLYGVIAYNVSQRTHELGIRIALGARSANVVWLVVRQGVASGALGIMIGVGVALAMAARLEPLLFAESPRDPQVYVLAVVAMMIVALLASFIPARRAATVDPNVSLRAE